MANEMDDWWNRLPEKVQIDIDRSLEDLDNDKGIPHHQAMDSISNLQGRMVSDDNVLSGKPVVKGTRISVEHIVSLLAQGWSEQKILENYPRLKVEDLKAIRDQKNI